MKKAFLQSSAPGNPDAQTLRYVSPFTSIFIMLTTVFGVLASGAILAAMATTYESSCIPDQYGKSICTQTFKFKGWEAIPLQGLPGAIGTGIGIYAAFKSGKLPGQKTEQEGEVDVSR